MLGSAHRALSQDRSVANNRLHTVTILDAIGFSARRPAARVRRHRVSPDRARLPCFGATAPNRDSGTLQSPQRHTPTAGIHIPVPCQIHAPPDQVLGQALASRRQHPQVRRDNATLPWHTSFMVL